jgi:hypothetical protein
MIFIEPEEVEMRGGGRRMKPSCPCMSPSVSCLREPLKREGEEERRREESKSGKIIV